jgi:hypothetical protein
MTKAKLSANDLIVKMLREKALLKQKIFESTADVFSVFRTILQDINKAMASEFSRGEEKLDFIYQEKGDFEAMLGVSSDTLIFQMHTNVFNFERNHHIWKSNYLREDENRAFCGVINVYNFLSDSFRYNRENDIGYLIARIFINKELHYFVEGKRQLGFLYNDFANSKIDQVVMRNIIESCILYALDFDLLLPGYEHINQISVGEIMSSSKILHQKTGKRLGFRFQADSDLD